MKSNIQGITISYRGSVGRIIFADLLESPTEKYRSFIWGAEISPFFVM